MKIKNLLLFLLSVAFIQVSAQQVDRQEVLLEIGTGTWCPYCPGAAMGADELVENGHDVAVIEYHNGDDYTNNASNARNSYYGITSFPTAKFDGVEEVVGGSSSSSMYSSYLPHYESRIAVPSSFTIDITGDHEDMIDFDIEVTMEKVADTDASDIKLRTAVTESHIEESWQGMDELNFVERMMPPDHNGVAMDFSDDDTQVVNLDFSLDEDWVVENCEFVVFLQDDATKEVLQAIKYPMPLIPGLNSYDLAVEDISNLPESDCMGEISPIVDVTNYGSETITSFTLEYIVNGESSDFEWEGTLETSETVAVELPTITYGVQDQNTFEVAVSQPNNQPDEYEGNNTASEQFEAAPETNTTVDLLLRTDNNPTETTWEIVNSAGEVIHSGGPYENPNSWVEAHTEYLVDPNDCYSFKLYDEGGDGLSDGNGMCVVESTNGVMVCSINGTNFGEADFSQYHPVSLTDILSPDTKSSMKVYPNPAQGVAHIDLGFESSDNATLEIFNTLGEKVYDKNLSTLNTTGNSIEISTGNFESGVYLIRLQAGNKDFKQRLIVK